MALEQTFQLSEAPMMSKEPVEQPANEHRVPYHFPCRIGADPEASLGGSHDYVSEDRRQPDAPILPTDALGG
jgi:hypothetical protein